VSLFLIAEIGINHNGQLDIAKQLIDASVDAGFDAVKFQKRTIDKVYTNDFLDSPRESPWGTTQRDQKESQSILTARRKEFNGVPLHGISTHKYFYNSLTALLIKLPRQCLGIFRFLS
jgi:hypothetical protein